MQRVLQKDVTYSLQHSDTFTLLADEYPFTVHITTPSTAHKPTANAATTEAAGRAVVEAMHRSVDRPKPAAPVAGSNQRECSYGVACKITTPMHRQDYYHPTTLPAVAASSGPAVTPIAATTMTGKRTRDVAGPQGTKRPASSDATSAANAAANEGDAPHAAKRAAAASDVHSLVTSAEDVKPIAKDAIDSVLAPPGSPVAQLTSPLKRTRIDGVNGAAHARSQGGARTLALPVLCTTRRSVRHNLPANFAARALAGAARPFLQRHIDDRDCKLVIVAPHDSDALRVLESLDEPIGEAWQYQIVRMPDPQAVARALVHMTSEQSCPARYICNEATWRLHSGGAPINRAIFDAAGDGYEEAVKKAHPLPAEVGHIYPMPLDAISPLRRNEGVHYIMHAVVPVIDPDSADCVPTEQAAGTLRQLYDELFTKFEQITLKNM